MPDRKVKLRDDAGNAKATSSMVLEAGEKLGIIIDNLCLQQERHLLNETHITKAALTTSFTIPELDTQAYEWILDRDYTEDELEQLAAEERCVVGISWNKEYNIQAAFNDTSLDTQQHLQALRALPAYDAFYNSQGGMSADQGEPVVVAVVDTGVDFQHPDLAANMLPHATGFGIDITTAGGTVDYRPFDVSEIGHGTHVAGLIGAVSNNSAGIIGAMPYRAKIMPIKVFARDSAGQLSTTSQHFYNAVKFAYTNGAHVINLSLGAVGPGAASDSLANSAITEAVANGSFVTVVIGNADAGNAGQLVDGTNYSSVPGQYSTKAGVVGVGSIDSVTGTKSRFSHYSPNFVELGAPGAQQGSTGLYSTLPRSLSFYGRLAGTSQAAPLVSAAAALTIGIIREAYGVAPTPAEVERLLLSSAVKNSSLNSFFKNGNTLDLVNLVRKIHTEYPLTASGGTGSLPFSCD